jgi:hypothetical protein
MNRAVSTILIPLLLMSQNLFSVPHSHVGMSIVESESHSARPHIHLRHTHRHRADHGHDGGNNGHGEHVAVEHVAEGHGAGGQAPTEQHPEQLPDHDSDAVYAGDTQLLNDGRITRVAHAELAAVCVICDESEAIAVSWLCTQLTSPPLQSPKCALYLQLLSIRC